MEVINQIYHWTGLILFWLFILFTVSALIVIFMNRILKNTKSSYAFAKFLIKKKDFEEYSKTISLISKGIQIGDLIEFRYSGKVHKFGEVIHIEDDSDLTGIKYYTVIFDETREYVVTNDRITKWFIHTKKLNLG